jgi:CBS domain-containing protein
MASPPAIVHHNDGGPECRDHRMEAGMQQPVRGVPTRKTGKVVLLPAEQRQTHTVSLESPGTLVMTDFDRTPVVTVEAGTQIDDALRLMKHAGVRSAVVVDEQGSLLGLVTAYDILGEKPVRLLESAGRGLPRGRAGIDVAAVMEPVDRWQVIDIAELKRRTVADVVASLRALGRTHVPVVERVGASEDRLRGLLSATEVARRTGADTTGLRAAQTFAEIEQAVHEGVFP